MDWKRVLLGLGLIVFLASTVRALVEHSYLGFFLIAGANSATRLMLLDLTLALALVAVWMVRDARLHGKSFVPHLVLTLLFGVAGPLVFLLTSPFSRRVQRLAAWTLLAALGGAAAVSWNYADLRTAEVKRPASTAAAEGRALLERVAQRHGLSAWRQHRTMKTVATDVWSSGGSWWPGPDQRFESQALLGTFTSRVELLDGPKRGEVWGIQAWRTYKQENVDVAPRFLPEPERAIEFYLPTLQYFNELPFRLLSADVVLDAGPARWRGRAFHRLFVSWGSPEPQADVDQYLLWIDRDTLLIEMVHYTVRDAVAMSVPPMDAIMKPLAVGTMHFDDYREIDGVMVPFEQTVTLVPPELTQPPVSAAFFHRIVLEEVSFDTLDATALLPDPSAGPPSDRKAG